MNCENILVWNVHGLNARAKRNMLREVVAQERVSLVMLQETMLDDCNDAMILDLFGARFDYFTLPTTNTCGGVLLAWHRDTWAISNPLVRDFSLTVG